MKRVLPWLITLSNGLPSKACFSRQPSVPPLLLLLFPSTTFLAPLWTPIAATPILVFPLFPIVASTSKALFAVLLLPLMLPSLLLSSLGPAGVHALAWTYTALSS